MSWAGKSRELVNIVIDGVNLYDPRFLIPSKMSDVNCPCGQVDRRVAPVENYNALQLPIKLSRLR